MKASGQEDEGRNADGKGSVQITFLDLRPKSKRRGE